MHPLGLKCSARFVTPPAESGTLYVARAIEVAGVGPMVALAEMPVPTLITALAEVANLPGTRLLVERSNGLIVGSVPADDLRIGQMRDSKPVAAGSSRGHRPASARAENIEASSTTLYGIFLSSSRWPAARLWPIGRAIATAWRWP